MKGQTIGVEIEMNSITREKAAQTVARYFGTTAWYASREYGYNAWACKDTQGRVWKFQRDGSINGPDDEKCEMVTPILKYEDMTSLQEIVRILRKAGAKSDASRGCGVHIHIGAAGHTPKTLRNLANIMASHERNVSGSTYNLTTLIPYLSAIYGFKYYVWTYTSSLGGDSWASLTSSTHGLTSVTGAIAVARSSSSSLSGYNYNACMVVRISGTTVYVGNDNGSANSGFYCVIFGSG